MDPYDDAMERMTVRFISATRTTDGSIRARARVESARLQIPLPAVTMNVVLYLPHDGADSVRPVPERVYDELLRYLDIA